MDHRTRRTLAAVVAGCIALVVSVAGCASSTPTAQVPVEPGSARDELAALPVDDRPSPEGRYRRDDWPHWEDLDGDGCDARREALLIWSTTTVSIDRSRGCWLDGGTWTSPYDELTTTRLADLEIDHLVPLAEAFRSGGWRWDAGERRQFANDQRELVPTSSATNQAKESSTPDEWRPPRVESWCAYAEGWIEVKAAYDLSVTTDERDALGRMLDGCIPTSDTWPTR